MNNTPTLVICCLAYNHERYIRDALEGFVMQKTDFPFVAIVHDDASTDGTADIIREYAAKYPHIIKPIFETENQYSKHDGTLSRIMYEACMLTGAKYFALCEGDDYWTDSDKLKTQVDFLEAHREYSMCFHQVNFSNESKRLLPHPQVCTTSREYSLREVLENWVIPTCSTVIRMDCIKKKPSSRDFCVGDNVLWVTCFNEGKVFGFKNVMGVYRQLVSGWVSGNYSQGSYQKREKQCKKWVRHYKALKSFFPNLDSALFDKLILDNMSTVTVMALVRAKFSNIPIKDYWREYGLRYITSSIACFARCVSIKLKLMAHKKR